MLVKVQWFNIKIDYVDRSVTNLKKELKYMGLRSCFSSLYPLVFQRISDVKQQVF